MEAKAANFVLREYWDGSLPVDPFRIAQNLGVDISSSDQLGDASGTFEIIDSKPIIRFNPYEPDVRQRFTIAHELGHFVLSHGKSFRDTTDKFSTLAYDPKEVAANKFAAELLMPKGLVDKLIKGGTTNPSELARRFGVSDVAMQYRLKNLRWI